MSDFYKDNNDLTNENYEGTNSYADDSENIYSSADTASSDTEETTEAVSETSAESSYEWNANSDTSTSSGEYHYSYVNGNNVNASHNPNNYENAYSSNDANTSYTSNTSSSASYNSPYNGYNQQSAYNSYNNTGSQQYNNSTYGTYSSQPYTAPPKKQKVQKPKKPASRGFIAVMLAITLVASGTLGFIGGYVATNANKTTDGSININKVESSGTASGTNASTASTTEIVQKTADSVVEIATESVVTGNFAQQYVQQGAGSGVIISDDGYIITNHHVIDGANNITVTLRDGTTSYNAALIGSDENNDIALLKVDATGLNPATFGDSSSLAVGDYVVAIGNPLGELGGTVTDGIISALAREVTIEDNNMTLLQTNAQISPGNSGGGLFNANGELVGIVNAKDSATEVEGIAFAIPINNVLDIINDLMSYGYVTGQIDIGMQLTDINSNESAFYYGVNQTGCYVISVTRGSNAEQAGFRTGDLITKVNGTEVTSTNEVEAVLEDCKVGDNVKFEIYRSGQTQELILTLAEYVPSGNTSQSTTQPAENDSYYDIWNDMFGW